MRDVELYRAIHGVKQPTVPWAERGSQFTALFDRLAIDLLREGVLGPLKKEQLTRHDQMPRGGNGQKFGQAFDQAHESGDEEFHKDL